MCNKINKIEIKATYILVDLLIFKQNSRKTFVIIIFKSRW
jgi:hypothetical protein